MRLVIIDSKRRRAEVERMDMKNSLISHEH